MNPRMMFAMAWIFACGAGVAQASTVRTFEILGQPFGGATGQVSVDVSDLLPGHYIAGLELQITGDYDTIGENLTVQLDHAVNPVLGIAGTDSNGNFHGFSRNFVRPGFIDFLQEFVIDRDNFQAAVAPNGQLEFQFLRSLNVGGGPDSRIYGALFIHSVSPPPSATVPEPSTLVLVSLGLVCAGCCTIRRRRTLGQQST
jgi:hypothetical protein